MGHSLLMPQHLVRWLLTGIDRNSSYAKHLMQAIKSKGVPIEQVFKEVFREVRKKTEGKQIPWFASSLQHDFYFNP